MSHIIMGVLCAQHCRVAHGGATFIMRYPPIPIERQAAADAFCASYGFAQAGTYQVCGLNVHRTGQVGKGADLTMQPASQQPAASLT